MLTLALLACVAALAQACMIRAPETCTTYPCLIFEDNFDSFNLNCWEHELTMGGGGNWEFQYYTNNRTNSYTKGGNLYIKPTLTEDKYGPGFVTSGTIDLWGSTVASECTGNAFYGCMRGGNPDNLLNPIQSARLRTTRSFGTRYGRVEVRARMPRGDWIWPAIWMMPTREGYGGWPASGEIDIVESRGNNDYVDAGNVQKGHFSAGQTLHWGPFWPYNGFELTTGERQGSFGTDFHIYGLNWDANNLLLTTDGQVVVNAAPPADGGFWAKGNFNLPIVSNPWRWSTNQRMAPFDQEFYFIVNVAVGGTNGFFPDNWTNRPTPKPWNNQSGTAFRDFWNARGNWLPTWNQGVDEGESAAMVIDYIRVWKDGPDPL
jgi:hypothetical protein